MARKALSYGEKVAKIGPVDPRDITRNTPNHDVNTQRNFHLLACSPKLLDQYSQVLHVIVVFVVLFNLAHTQRYPIPFLNARAISAGGVGNFAPFLHKIGCHGNVPWDIEKKRSPNFHELYKTDCQLTCYNHSCDIPIRFRMPVCQMNEYRPISACLLYTSPSPRDRQKSRMPSSA